MKELNKKMYCRFIEDCGGCEKCTLCASYDIDLSKIEQRKQEIKEENGSFINAYKNPEAKKEIEFLNTLKEETQPKRNKKAIIDKYNLAINKHINYIEILEILKNNVDQKFNNKVYNKRFNNHLSELLKNNTNYRIYKSDCFSADTYILFKIYPDLHYNQEKFIYLDVKDFLPDEEHKRINLDYFKNKLQEIINIESKQIEILKKDMSNLLELSKKYQEFINLQKYFNELNSETRNILDIEYNNIKYNTLLNIE